MSNVRTPATLKRKSSMPVWLSIGWAGLLGFYILYSLRPSAVRLFDHALDQIKK